MAVTKVDTTEVVAVTTSPQTQTVEVVGGDGLIETVVEQTVTVQELAPAVILQEEVAQYALTVTDQIVSIDQSNQSVAVEVLEEQDVRLDLQQETISVVVSSVGPQGPPGPSGTNTVLVYGTAGQDLSGHRVVSVNSSGLIVYADPSGTDVAFAGLTVAAAISGTTVAFVTSGVVEEPSWNWTPGTKLFVGPAGVLSSTAPTSGTSKVCAVALTPTSINVAPQISIVLSP